MEMAYSVTTSAFMKPPAQIEPVFLKYRRERMAATGRINSRPQSSTPARAAVVSVVKGMNWNTFTPVCLSEM